MKSFILGLLLLISATAYGQYVLSDLADVPPSLREKNWLGRRWCESCQRYHGREGSCVHASLITLLNYHGLDQWAIWWKKSYGGGETAEGIVDKMNKSGLPFTYTNNGSVDFLEYTARNRLGCVICYFPAHCVTMVDLTPVYALLIDNNKPGEYIRVPREEFINQWQNIYGGFALTLVLPPPPPTPK